MNKKIIKQILIIITLLMVLFAIYKLVQAYGVFYSEATATVSQEQAKWIIKINGTNISSGIEQEFVVDQIEIAGDSHVAPNKLAPGTSGNFYIVIDPGNTDVAVKYEIKLDKSNLVNQQIKIESIEEVLNGNALVETSQDAYTGVISLADIKAGKTNKIKVSINWQNDEANNEEDTKVGTTKSPKLQIPIEVTVSQYLGENVEQYTPQNITE